ncbi:hypothetical protein HN51_035479 [Arachis hypogaea]
MGEQHGHRLWHLSPYAICCCIPQMKAGRGFCPSPKLVNKSLHKSTMEPTLTLFEEAVADSQEKINALISDFGISEFSGQQLTIAKELSQKIESMEGLLKQLWNKT